MNKEQERLNIYLQEQVIIANTKAKTAMKIARDSETILTTYKNILKRIRTAVGVSGWLFILGAFIIACMDIISELFLTTDIFSFSSSEGFGIGQWLGIAVFSVIGTVLVCMGNWKNK